MPGLLISNGNHKKDGLLLLQAPEKARNKKWLIIFAFLLIFVYFIIYNRAHSYLDITNGISRHQVNAFVKHDGVSKLGAKSKQVPTLTERTDFLINTPGCYLPNYSKTLRFKEAQRSDSSCGVRAVFVNKLSNESAVEFVIDEEKMKEYTDKIQNVRCCYRFVSRSNVKGEEDTKINYSPCEIFENGTKANLVSEFITVTCTLHLVKEKEIYDDAYLILKKIDTDKNFEKSNSSWNILLLGMDTMSRARVYATMPKTVDYLQQNDWLDYRGYHKVDYNTFPNIMSVLTGKNQTESYRACKGGLSECNPLMMWSRYKETGYRTAYAEDFLRLPDTFCRFGGFKTPPTDHYTRPFFLTGEDSQGNLVCAKKLPSALHLLSYAKQFVYEYREENFFGMFWLNSYSHNENNLPSRLDEDVVNLFSELNENGILNNTFVFFFSDHGIRYGDMRLPVESFYEERLPMLFIWVPQKFRELYPVEYSNMQINQNRLTTPYDLHATLWSLLKISNNSVEVIPPEACLQCRDLFTKKSYYRTCRDAAISKKWCSCYNLVSANQSRSDVNISLKLAVENMQNVSQSIETTGCNTCSFLTLKRVIRIHSYKDEIDDKRYYVIAFEMSPGDVRYESTVEESGGEFALLQPTFAISPYNTRGSCVKNRYDRAYCVCANNKCNKKH